MEVNICYEGKKFAFVQSIDVTLSLDDMNRALWCVFLRQSTDVDTDYTLAQRSQSSEALKLKAGRLLAVEPVQFIKSTLHVQQENFAAASIQRSSHDLLKGFTLTFL